MSTTVSAKVKAAKQSRDNILEERTILLALIVRLIDDPSIHIAPTQQPDSGLLPYVLCIHDKDVALTWKISAEEYHAYFGRLDMYPCKKKIAPRDARLARLARLAEWS